MSGAVLVIHGGAGVISKASLTPSQRLERISALQTILSAGSRALEAGASATDVVESAVRALEDCPHFNAGHGAVLTSAATHELDAAIMCGGPGVRRRAGAVACMSTTRNPVSGARAVMDAGVHVMLAGAGADLAAAAAGLQQVDNSYFTTPARAAQLKEARAAGVIELDHGGGGGGGSISSSSSSGSANGACKRGTVGAVARDVRGGLAAATSTGGMCNKAPGRVGDTPVPGAGTWADATVAVSCTGTGEAFLLACAAHEVSARMRLAGETLAVAASTVIHKDVPAAGGDGGLIAVSAGGDIAMPFCSAGMYRGWARAGEAAVHVGVHEEPEEPMTLAPPAPAVAQ